MKLTLNVGYKDRSEEGYIPGRKTGFFPLPENQNELEFLVRR